MRVFTNGGIRHNSQQGDEIHKDTPLNPLKVAAYCNICFPQHFLIWKWFPSPDSPGKDFKKVSSQNPLMNTLMRNFFEIPENGKMRNW